MACPKCGHPRDSEDTECRGCGLIFAKWEARRRSLAEAAVQPPQTHAATAGEPVLDDWSRRWARWAAVLLFAGFLLPLFKHSMLAGDSFLVWPWQLAGLSRDPGIVAALATYSEGGYPGSWTLLPLATACLVLLAGRLANVGRRGMAHALAGLGALLLLLLLFVEENQRLGLVFTPPTFGAGVVTAIGIVAGALIAAANHASRLQPGAAGPARWAGAGGVALALMVAFFMLGGDGPWKAWSMWGLYSLLLAYALLAAARLFGAAPGPDSIERLGRLGRGVVAWSLIAVILAQNADRDGFSLYVVQGGGGLAGTVFAAAKGFLIFFGSTLAMAVGMASILAGARPAGEAGAESDGER